MNLKKQRLTLLAVLGPCLFMGYTPEAHAIPGVSVTAPQQAKKVSGTVSDAEGPVIGATVRVDGTQIATVTDLDGNFTLNAPEGSTITISYVGYTDQKFKVGSQSTYKVTLQQDNKSLDEVVVVGYGTMKKKLVTGATVQVKGDDLQKLNTTNALQAMQSKTPGVQITQSTAQPGGGYKVYIRGVGTTGDSAPLYVIDGVAGGSLDNVNPADIESIDVLKDAASAAIYGARAANGVILVTTKQGRAGKLEIDYDGYFGWSNPYKRPATLNAQEYMKISDEYSMNTVGTTNNWASMIPNDIMQKLNNGWTGTDWWDLYQNKNALQTSHSVNLTGGSERSKFSMGFSYTSNDGIMGDPVESFYHRYTGRINSEHIILKGKTHSIITLGENLSLYYNRQHQLAENDTFWNSIHPTFIAPPVVPAFDDNGNIYQYNAHSAGWYSQLFDNPYAGLVNGDYNSGQYNRNFGFGGTMYAIIEPIKDLKIRTQYNVGLWSSNNRSLSQPYSRSLNGSSSTYSVTQGEYSGSTFDWENTISYKLPEFLKDNTFDVLAGFSYQGDLWNNNLSATGSVTEGNKLSILKGYDYAWLDNIGSGGTFTTPTGSGDSKWRLASYFGRLNWNWKETYMATVTVRYDGSSNFARGHRWGTFPSASAGWVMTNEKFMDFSKKWLDYFKIRGSWGQNGNQNISPFQYLATVAFSNPTTHADGYVFNGDLATTLSGDYTTGAYTDILPNEDVTWETSEQWDFGFDAQLFGSRLGVNFDWYNKKTKDWLVVAPTLDIYGTGAPYINGGDVKNTGVELALSWNDKIGKDFHYFVNGNISTNKNKVTRIANAEGIIRGSARIFSYNSDYVYCAQVGEPIGYFYGMSYSGIWQNQQQIDDARAQGKAVLSGAQPGDPIWDDWNHDGVITYADNEQTDRHKIGDPHPDVNVGLSFGFDYKGFDFSVTTYGAFGLQAMREYRGFIDNQYNNYTKDVYERWHGEGTSNKRPRLANFAGYDWISTLSMENADYWKIQNLTVGYDFTKLWKTSPFQQLRLYFQAQNLYTFTGYKGLDPEIGSTAGKSESWGSGIDLGLYPTPRTYLVGVSIKF